VPKLHEYRGEILLRSCGIAVPEGDVALTPEETYKIAKRLMKAVAIKSQVGVTGRLQAGGIRFADNADDAKKIAEEMLGKEIKGLKIEKVLVEEKLSIKDEFYANVDILTGLTIQATGDLISKLDVSLPLVEPLSKVVYGLYEVFRKYDARSVEVNPIVLTEDDKIYAADCHIVIDEASVFKHSELEIDYPRDIGRVPTELERLAWEIERKDYRGIGYFVQMTQGFGPGEGVVGFHGIGGGGAMLGADALIRHGLKLANYADTSGNPTASKVYRIVKTIFSQPNIDGYVLMGAAIANQEQWHHAHALVKALREELKSRPNFPVIILIAGNKEVESLEILKEGLKGLSTSVEIYGRDYVYNVDFIAERMKELIKEYRRN